MDWEKLAKQLELEIEEIREEIDRLDDQGRSDQNLYRKLAEKQKSLDAIHTIKV